MNALKNFYLFTVAMFLIAMAAFVLVDLQKNPTLTESCLMNNGTLLDGGESCVLPPMIIERTK